VTRQDRPAGPGLHLNWYNGTIEGTPAVDPVTGILYVGRGDGYLYAVDPKTGKVAWKFLTIDPARPDDPEGGGEIVGGPLVTPDGIIVFATFAAPPSPKPPHKLRHETNAVYAINRSGKMLWRYPATGSTPNAFNAPPALSPDGSRVYAVTALVGPSSTSQLVAIDRLSGALLWELPLPNSGGQDLACGKNGVIYVAGMSKKGFGWRPAGFAVKDDGKTGSMFWGPVELDDHMQKTHMTGGVALYETEDNVQDVFMSTTIMKNLNTAGGQLHRLDPATGRITSSWDPKKASPACPGGLTDVSLDKDRTIYVGVRGQRPKVRGRMYALKLDKGEYRVLWSHQLDAQIDWASPAIGPDGGLFFGSTDTIGPFQMLKHFATKPADSLKNIPDADPVFYGIRDKSL
jgi:outer membrane protein assembly factor BamB